MNSNKTLLFAFLTLVGSSVIGMQPLPVKKKITRKTTITLKNTRKKPAATQPFDAPLAREMQQALILRGKRTYDGKPIAKYEASRRKEGEREGRLTIAAKNQYLVWCKRAESLQRVKQNLPSPVLEESPDINLDSEDDMSLPVTDMNNMPSMPSMKMEPLRRNPSGSSKRFASSSSNKNLAQQMEEELDELLANAPAFK